MTATNNLQTWPADIWLNVGDAGHLPPKDECAEVTWCDSGIDRHDVRYIRHDLVDQQLNDLHRSVAGAVQHAEAGWARYEAANADRNAVRAERVQLVARIAEMERRLAEATP